MRQVSGFERPGVQWLFVLVGVVLVAVGASEAVALHRAHTQIASLRAADLNARIEADTLRGQIARERAARESLSLQLARERGTGAPGVVPTLTLSPLNRRGAQPPDPTVGQPADNQLVQLRLLLPASEKSDGVRYRIAIRLWAGGDSVWSRGGLTTTTVDHTRMVTAFISGDVLTPGAYEIALTTDAGDKSVDVAAYEVGVRVADRR